MDKRIIGIGALGAVAVLGYLLLSKKDKMQVTGGGSAGQSAGFEGGGVPWNLIFGGETINFPTPEKVDINSLLPPMPDGESSKKTVTSPGYLDWGPSGGLTLVGIDQWTPEKAQIARENKEKYGIPSEYQGLQDGQALAPGGSNNDLLSALGVGLGFVSGPFGALFGLASVAATGTGKKADIGSSGASGAGVIGSTGSGYTGSSGWMGPAPAAILSGGKKSSSGGGSVTSQEYGGSGSVASYLSGKYGATHDIRGYSVTGVPLYKPKVN